MITQTYLKKETEKEEKKRVLGKYWHPGSWVLVVANKLLGTLAFLLSQKLGEHVKSK